MKFKRRRFEMMEGFSFEEEEREEAISKINEYIDLILDNDEIKGLSIELGRCKKFSQEDETVYNLGITYHTIE